jgi:hypothetical protein
MIKVNGQSLNDFLADEKAKELKEVVYDIQVSIRRSVYRRPSARSGKQSARPGKVKLIKSKEDVFLLVFDQLDTETQELLASATRSQQDKVWSAWLKADHTEAPLNEILTGLIQRFCNL